MPDINAALNTEREVQATITQPPAIEAEIIAQGPRGATGATGATGAQGEQGVQGIQGVQGVQGEAATITVGTVTTGEPGSSAIFTNVGTANDAIIDVTIPAGSVWRSGAGAPSNDLGVNGDYYLNTTTSDVYLKATGTYSVIVNIKGAQGIQGEQGIQGVQGDPGADGLGVPAGGTTGQLLAKQSNADNDTVWQDRLGADENFVTDAEKTVIQNTSGTNTGDETTLTLGSKVNAADAKATPADADLIPTIASSVVKKTTWAQIKTALAAIFVTPSSTDTLTNKTLTSPTVDGDVSGDAVLDEDDMVSDSDTKLATQQSIKAYVDASVGKVSSDGWNTADAMTYASTTTVTIAGDVISKYPKGTKIKLTQTTTKYFVVINATYSDPNTTLTLMGGSDFTVAEAAITDPFLSYESTPQGFPQWFAFTANATGFSSKTQDAGRIRIEGTHVYIWLYILGTSNANTLTCTIPVTLKKRVFFPCRTRDNNVLQSSWGAGDSNADASNTLSFYLSPSGSGWATSNTKGVEFCLAQGELN